MASAILWQKQQHCCVHAITHKRTPMPSLKIWKLTHKHTNCMVTTTGKMTCWINKPINTFSHLFQVRQIQWDRLSSEFWGPEHNKSKSIGQHTGGPSSANHWYIMQDNARCCHITAKDKQCQQITIRVYALRKWWRDMIERNKNTFHRASIKIRATVPIVLRNIAGSKSKAHFE